MPAVRSRRRKTIALFVITLIALIALPVAFFLARSGVNLWSDASNSSTTLQQKQAEYSDIRATTHYAAGIAAGYYPYDSLVTDIPKMKAAGFNTLYFVLPWNEFSSDALAPTYRDAQFNKLLQALELVKKNDMKAILPLNFLGQGWSPAGIDACNWIWDDTQYAAFETYATEFLTRVTPYADSTYIMVFSEGTEGCEQEAIRAHYENPTALSARLRETLGSFASRLPRELRQKYKIGYHDYLVGYPRQSNRGKEISPVKNAKDFDFISMVVYSQEQNSTAQIEAELQRRLSLYRDFFPESPLIIGESGAASCIGSNTEENQARVNTTVARFALAQRLGVNIWGWKPHATQECDPNGSALGLAMTRTDGSYKPVVNELQKLFAPTFDAPPMVITSYSPWAISLVGKNYTSRLRVRLYDQGRQWGNDIPVTLSADHTWASINLPANLPPSECNRSGPCNVEIQLVDSRSGLTSARTALQLPRVQSSGGSVPASPTPTPRSSPIPSPQSSPATAPVLPKTRLSQAGVEKSFTPWAVWVLAQDLQPGLQVRLYDKGSKWGGDITPTVAADMKSLTFLLPSNQPPSNCNANTSCEIEVRVFDTASGWQSNSVKIVLPRR